VPARRKPIYGEAASPQQEYRLEQHLEALISTPRQQSIDIPIDRIRPNPFQARRIFDGIDELADVIRAQGFTTRLRVRPDPVAQDTFQLVFGERRLQAATQAGLTVIPCDVREHTDVEMVEIGLAENIQRRDLHPLEEAEALRTMIEQRGYSERSLAERLGKDRGYIQNRLALLRAPADVQELVAQRPDTISAARAIAQLSTPEARRPLLEGVASGSLTHRDVLAIVQKVNVEDMPAPTTINANQGVMPHGTPTNASAPAVQSGKSNVHIQRPARASASVLARALERDVPMLHATIARWRLALPKSRMEERAYMHDAVQECIAELQAILQALERTGR